MNKITTQNNKQTLKTKQRQNTYAINQAPYCISHSPIFLILFSVTITLLQSPIRVHCFTRH